MLLQTMRIVSGLCTAVQLKAVEDGGVPGPSTPRLELERTQALRRRARCTTLGFRAVNISRLSNQAAGNLQRAVGPCMYPWPEDSGRESLSLDQRELRTALFAFDSFPGSSRQAVQ